MVKRILAIFLCSAAIYGCNNVDFKGFFMPTGDGVEKRFEQSAEMNDNLCAGAVQVEENYAFYAATDPHIENTNINLSLFNDALRNDTEASFGVILGDCIEIRDNLDKYLQALTYKPETHANDPRIFHILGNHDTYFDGWADFKEKIGPSVYWFEAAFTGGKDLYISLDTATGTLGRKQTQWLRTFLTENRQDYRHCILLTHTNFFYTDNTQFSSGNMPFEESLALIDFLGKQNATLVLQGHDHYREDLTYANVRYTILGAIHDNTKAPEYLKIHVTPDGVQLDWQYLPSPQN